MRCLRIICRILPGITAGNCNISAEKEKARENFAVLISVHMELILENETKEEYNFV